MSENHKEREEKGFGSSKCPYFPFFRHEKKIVQQEVKVFKKNILIMCMET